MAASGIFISYRRQDAQSAAGRLADGLEQRFGKAQIFRDVETIQPGVDFVEAIGKALSACSVMLVVIGRRWMGDAGEGNRLHQANDWIRLEVAAALERNIRVIPVLVEGAPPPADADLPEDLKALARRQAHTLSDERWDYDVQQLAAALESTGVRPLPVPKEKPKSSRLVKTLAWIGGVMVVLMVIGAVTEGLNQDSSVPSPPKRAAGLPSGTPISACGCWGYVNLGATRPNPKCASGTGVAAPCPALCAGGGYQWQEKCI